MIFESLKELEIILSDLVFSGIKDIDDSFIERLYSFSVRFERFKMNGAEILVKDLVNSIKDYKRGAGSMEEVASNISRLEFYLSGALRYERLFIR